MTPALATRAAATTTSAFGRWLQANPSAISVTVGLVIVVALVLSKMREHELQPRRRMVLPVVILAAGVAVIAPQVAHSPEPTAIDYAVVGLDLALSLVLGAVRGLTIHLSLRDRTWWYRYRPVTVSLWALSIVARSALGWFASAHGAIPVVASGSVLFMLGLSLLSQNLTVLARASRRTAALAASRRESVTTSPKGLSR